MKLFGRVRNFLSNFYTGPWARLSFDHAKGSNESRVHRGRYIFPAESERHEATIMGFPSRCSLPPDQYDAVCNELAQLALTIAEFEPVRLYVRPEDIQLAESLVKGDGTSTPKITLIPCPINHCWVRDTGPVYVRDTTGAFPNRRFAINFRFNEWGDKKPENDGICWGQQWPVMNDQTLQENTNFARLCQLSELTHRYARKGGGLVTDGDGTLLITESSIVCEARNPGMTKADIEMEMKRLLGVDKVIWFPGRRNVDITDVHMDAEARFVRPGVIAYSKPHAVSIELWQELSAEIRDILGRETDAKGRRLEIHTIEEPDPRGLMTSDEELAASYVNFYFVNGGLIIPKFGDKERDQRALEVLQSLVPERVVRQVYASAIPLTGGVLHCVTQQVPEIL
ncbi:hypothetical protein N7452_010849 [Penicillium brevicompactum]|uniref:Peptidyl-arginine deiminase, Porphyromonas-type n=1 Tax=Penicillium brevicompactum TaxID=5074 RepID=A0A9W9Q0W9_PENBR|nr:hypothetical protein N7452_010849 [Penicillium brevicompactum]